MPTDTLEIETELTSIPKIPPGKRPKRFNLEKAKELRLIHNLSYPAIAQFFGLKDHKYVWDQLQPFVTDTDGYAKNRVNILRSKQMQLMSAMTPEKVQKAGLNVLGLTYGILYDKERLELGKSTQNIDYSSLHKTSESLEARLAELKAQELELTQSTDGVYEASTVTKSGKHDTKKG